MKKSVVIGGSGFIGSHVADELTNSGYQVTVYDKSKSKWLRDDQEFVMGDIQNKEKLIEVIANTDVVYNFAALADIDQALENPESTVITNILGNVNVLEACRVNKVGRFIYASTIYVYSGEGGFYRCSKQASEAYVQEYQKTHGLDYTILRYGSLYGPRADQTNGIYCIIESALHDGFVSYKGDIDSMREYIHVSDAAKASVKILNDDFKNKSIVLTGQEPMKVVDMLHMLSEILGFPTSTVQFAEDKNIGHYIRTPYSYQPKLDRKYIPPMHVDLGQGLLQLIDILQDKIKSDK